MERNLDGVKPAELLRYTTWLRQ